MFEKWRNQREKRKNSSDSSEAQNKSARVGGSPGGCEVSEGNTSISEVLKQSNDVLYNDSKVGAEELDISIASVFETAPASASASASASDRYSKMASESNDTSDIPKNPTNSDIMTMLTAMKSDMEKKSEDIDKKLEKIDKKLERLDIVEKKVDKFELELKSLWTRIHDNNKKLDERIARVEDSVENRDFTAGVLSDKVEAMQKAADKAKEELLYIQSQSMRNNLVFSNIPEDGRETGEVTEEKIRAFLVDTLEMARESVEQIKFERVHRMGQRIGGKHRQIVAKFCYFKEREMVKKERSKLKNTNFFISEQFPKEVAEKRKKLLPKMWEARNNTKSAWIAYDTLYIDGRVVKDGNQ